ncbi:MAG: hypothetical protein ABIK44_02170 [candidate division WOR-3 bacterium]
MFQRILYIVSEKMAGKDFVIDLARKYGSTVLLSALAPCEHLQPARTQGETRKESVREKEERKSWHKIYELEDEFKSQGIKASVVCQEGGLEKLQLLANTTRCDLLVLAADNLADHDYKLPEELLPNLPCPLIITNPT